MNLKKPHLLCFLSLLFYVGLYAQDITVSGTINDETGVPVPGAAVVVKNTTHGTSADFDGKFQLEAPSDAILVISSIGFATVEVPVNGQNEIDITLQSDTQNLEEVVVVGYGTQKNWKIFR